jgi:cytochrome c2
VTEPQLSEASTLNAVVSVAIYLALVSLAEYKIAASGHGPSWFTSSLLVGALTLKALGILLVYMRLYQAPRQLLGAVLATWVVVLYSTWQVVAPMAWSQPVRTGAPEALVVPGRAAMGRQLTRKFGCVSCHTVPGMSTLANGLGPDLSGLADRAGGREAGRSAEAYIRESIEDPGAYVVRGYLPWMPALRSKMTRQEFEDLVAFLETLHAER